MNDPASNPLRRYIDFERGGQRFAAPLGQLQEVLSTPGLRPLPGAEGALAGLMSLREWILPVFDPVALTGPERATPPASGVVLVLGTRGEPILGLLAERVGRMMELPALEPLTHPVRLSAAFAGECRDPGDGRLLVVNPESLAAAMGLVQAPAA